MTFFKATDDQLATMAANAVNAALVVGAGILHYQPDHVFTPADFIKDIKAGKGKGDLHLDYVEGRCTKLHIWNAGEKHLYKVRDDRLHRDYETWGHKYKSYEALLKSAGITPEATK